MRLDCCVFIFVTTIVFSSINLAQSDVDVYIFMIIILSLAFNAALISLSLTYAMALMDDYAFFMRSSTEVENLVRS